MVKFPVGETIPQYVSQVRNHTFNYNSNQGNSQQMCMLRNRINHHLDDDHKKVEYPPFCRVENRNNRIIDNQDSDDSDDSDDELN